MISANVSRGFIKSSIKVHSAPLLWGYSIRSNKSQRSQTWPIPFWIPNTCRMSFGSKWLLKYLLQELLECLSLLNQLDPKLKTIPLFFCVCIMMSPFQASLAPLLYCLLKASIYSFLILFLLIKRVSSFVWNLGDCSFPHLLSFRSSGNSLPKGTSMGFPLIKASFSHKPGPPLGSMFHFLLQRL